jgi:cyclopropane-fatty-acyl-phospholipid synthase
LIPFLSRRYEMREVADNKTFNSIFGPDGSYDIEKWLMRKQMALLGNPPIDIVLWDGSTIPSMGGKAVGTIFIRDRKTCFRLFIHPELYFGEAYSEGTLEVEGDLVVLLETISRSVSAASCDGLLRKNLMKLTDRPKLNSQVGSRDNIHHHYDIGNDFYQLWLDEKMQYTCAYFFEPAATLEEAQAAKMDHVCKKLRLVPGETVAEAGCGWGGLARHMARYYGVKVKAFNISHEQILYARERAKSEGLDDRVEYIEDDYRNIAGRFDAFVSVGMLEHVGPDHYQELGKVIERSLREDGRGLIHSIGRNRTKPINPWIERRIFPGAYMPTLREMMALFESSGFSILDVENLRLHYARTLECWLERFERAHDQIGRMFDQKFIRSWRLYLAGSVAAFMVGDLQLFQVVFTSPTNNDLPWSRSHLYVNDSR